jgi:hypothetical protein
MITKMFQTRQNQNCERSICNETQREIPWRPTEAKENEI